VKDRAINIELVTKAVSGLFREALIHTSNGMVPEGSGIRYEDMLKLISVENCSQLLGIVLEPLLNMELKHWTMFNTD